MCHAHHFASGYFVSGCSAIFFSSIGLFSPPVFEPFNIKKKTKSHQQKRQFSKSSIIEPEEVSASPSPSILHPDSLEVYPRQYFLPKSSNYAVI